MQGGQNLSLLTEVLQTHLFSSNFRRVLQTEKYITLNSNIVLHSVHIFILQGEKEALTN